MPFRSLLDRHTSFVLVFLLLLWVAQTLAQAPLLERGDSRESLEQTRELVERGQYERAIPSLEDQLRQTARADQRQDILRLLTRCYIGRQRYEDAYQSVSRYLAENPAAAQQPRVLYDKGLSAYYTERYDDAATAFERLLHDHPSIDNRSSVRYWYALVELNRGREQHAAELARLGYESSAPSSSRDDIGADRILLLWAVALERQDDMRAAKDRLEQLLRDYPLSGVVPETRIRLAAVNVRLGDNAGARASLDATKAETARQRNEWLFLSAEVDYRAGRFDAARREYENLLKEFPSGEFSRQARIGLAWICIRQNMLPDALHALQPLRSGSDSLTEIALYQIGAIALLEGNTAEATAAFEELVSKFPYDSHADNAYFETGMVYYRTRQFAEARRNFQLASRLFPESEIRVDAYRMLGEASLALGDLQNAQFAFSRVRKISRESSTQPSKPRVRTDLASQAELQEGIALYQLGRFNSSADRFDNFIRTYRNHPALGEAYFWRGEALYQASKFDDAEQAYSTAASLLPKTHPRREDALYGFAWTFFEQKKFRKAIAAYDRFSDEYPRSEHIVDATLRKADCFFFLREYDTANQLYEKLALLKRDPRISEYSAFQLGLSFIQRGDTERGIEHLRNFLRTYPNSLYVEVVQFNIAWAYFSREQFTKADEEFHVFERQYPQSQLMPRVLLNSGDAFYNLGLYDSARTSYRRLIAEYPSSLLVPDAVNGLQFTFQAQGRPREAIAVIESLLAKKTTEENAAGLLTQKADILFSQGEFGQAAVEYLRILDHPTGDSLKARVLYQLGRIYELENNSSKAASYFSEVNTSFPLSDVAPSALLSLGLLSARQNRWSAAIGHLRQFESRYPTSSLRWEAEYNVGLAQISMKNVDAARAQFESVVQLAPRDEVFADRSRLQIARMDQASRKYPAAIDTLSDVVARRNDDIAAEALLLMGEIYLTMRKPSDALQSFGRVSEGFANYPLLAERAFLGSGECYERLGDRTQAREMYSRVADTAVDQEVKRDAEERLRRLRR